MGGILGDEAGLVHTIIFISYLSNLLASRVQWRMRSQGDEHNNPNLVTVPKTLLETSVDDVNSPSGDDIYVYTLDDYDPRYLNGDNIIIADVEQMAITTPLRKHRNSMFCVVIDEAQTIKQCHIEQEW
ncbi:hypothetical protein LTR08_008930 [Meristemomyces frigidus]|nr:hypothetical protein LTR08_008930 [Meristemomyces frigidus]